MKKILLVIFISAMVFGQENQTQSLLSLKTHINNQTLNLQSDSENPLLPEKKSAPLAILYSLLLPGMGELYAGSYETGKYFTITEGALWCTYIGMDYYSGWQKDNYRSFAVSRGGVNLEGKDDDYFANIGSYVDITSYNDEKYLERDFDNVYDETSDVWNWNTDAARIEYRNMWRSSEQAKNNLRFVVGAMIINRIISAVNAARIVAARNKAIKEMSWNISVSPTTLSNMPSGLSVNVGYNF